MSDVAHGPLVKYDFESYFDNVISYPVTLGDITFNHLFFADDFVLISESTEGLQNCMDWKLHKLRKKQKLWFVLLGNLRSVMVFIITILL